jgi:hypothetical protein
MTMVTRKVVFSSFGRTAVVATLAAVAMTVVEPSVASAGALSGKGQSKDQSMSSGGVTDVSARRRYHRGGGGAAAAAAFAGIVGTGIAIAASQNRRDYDRNYYDSYYGGPAYAPAPAYYGPGYYRGGYGYRPY